jgi:hypothetical protein
MRSLTSFLRLFLASSLFMAGLAIQFLPSAAGVARESRWREQQFQGVAPEERAQAILDRDRADARGEAYLRLFGVFLGGLGLALALAETAYLCGQNARREAPLTHTAPADGR